MDNAETTGAPHRHPVRRRVLRIALGVLAVVLVLGVAGFIWFQVSVTPSVWLLRAVPGSDALDGGRGLAAFVPADVESAIDVRYGNGADDRLDVYVPAAATGPLPTIVWMHGGGFIGGNKEGTRDWLKVLASHGYTVVNVEYTPGPEAHWPEPIRQLDLAIDFIEGNAARFHVDPTQFVLGGDSAGAHMVSQAAVAVTNPDFAAQSGVPVVMQADQLKGVILFSGPYDLAGIDFDNGTWGFFLRTVLWAYTGHKDFLHTADTPFYSVTPWVTAAYPPAFISTGPGDPLLPQSETLVATLEALGAPVRSLFFPAGTPDSVGHEYQMDLNTPQAKLAMVDTVAFLRSTVSTLLALPGVTAGWDIAPSFGTPVASPVANPAATPSPA